MHGLAEAGGECSLGDGFDRRQAAAAAMHQLAPGMLPPASDMKCPIGPDTLTHVADLDRSGDAMATDPPGITRTWNSSKRLVWTIAIE